MHAIKGPPSSQRARERLVSSQASPVNTAKISRSGLARFTPSIATGPAMTSQPVSISAKSRGRTSARAAVT